VILFLGITLVLMGTLGWLGWRLFQQDRALERQRVQDRLERAADLVATELQRELSAVEDQLARLSTTSVSDLPQAATQCAEQFSEDAVIVLLDSIGVEAYPSARLLYYPVVSPSHEPQASVFARVEAAEFRDLDFVAAARVYRRQAQSGDATVRAGALLRLARAERKAGDSDAALATFAELAVLRSTSVGGLPAELVARSARLDLLHDASRDDDLRSAAESLYTDLHSGRWRVTRAQYEFYSAELCEWIPCDSSQDTAALGSVKPARALAAGVERLWDRRTALDGSGREVTWFDGNPVMLVWQHAGERTVGLVGGRQHLESDWLAGLGSVLERENVGVALSDVDGNALTTLPTTNAALFAMRTAADTRLLWTLRVASSDPQGDFVQLAERRRLLLLGLATLALLLLVGLYAVTRGVTRELEAARLQSDFVAAVSHEFRTPLTSLKQLAELLSSGRVSSEERRARYYQVMERESGRLHRLVEGLLDFGRMEAGALEFHWEKVAVGDLVRNVVTEFETEVAVDGYRVELADNGSAATARVDVEALSRAVWNLLDNAVKYSPECQTVWVDVRSVDTRVVVAVRDRGAGIAPSESQAIFKKFVRGKTQDGRGAKGTGIGLAMVQHIVEAHGGEVRVESEVGQGSTFSIMLPIEE
jgi:signal transduction histidine kinase/predicted negative regulator of RcsB-dependent stress response